MPYVFQGHPSNFKVTQDKKIVDFDPNYVFPDCGSSLNSQMAMECYTKSEVTYLEVLYCFSRSSVKSRAGQKIFDFDPNMAFPDCNSSLNSSMSMKWYTMLEVAYNRCPIISQGHPSNLKFTRGQKIVDFDPNRAFPGCNPSLNSLMALK